MVFVFAVTQVTHYAAHHLDVSGILRTVAVFWLIWWAWSQFTWALNAANTDHQHVRVVTLVSTGVAFAMAFSVENAFSAAPRRVVLAILRRSQALGPQSRYPTSQSGSWASVSTTELLATARTSEWRSVRLLDYLFRVSLLSSLVAYLTPIFESGCG